MRDFNFFEPYLDKKDVSSWNNLILYIIGAVLVLGLIIFPVVNGIKINSLKKNITVMKNNLESSDTYERINIVEQKEEKLAELEQKLSLLESVDRVIESRDLVNDVLLERVTNKVPKDVYFKSLSLSQGQIQIQGGANHNLAIAHLENNLKSDDTFKDIYIPSISLSEGIYNFSINFALNDDFIEDSIEEDETEEDITDQKDVNQDEA